MVENSAVDTLSGSRGIEWGKSSETKKFAHGIHNFIFNKLVCSDSLSHSMKKKNIFVYCARF